MIFIFKPYQFNPGIFISPITISSCIYKMSIQAATKDYKNISCILMFQKFVSLTVGQELLVDKKKWYRIYYELPF